MTSPIKPNLPCSLAQMRRHATIGGSLPRREAVALLDRVEQLEQLEAIYLETMRLHCPESVVEALDVLLETIAARTPR